VAVGDLNGDGFAEIVAINGGPTNTRVRIYDGNSVTNDANPQLAVPQFSPFGDNFKGGGTVAVGDYNGDGALDLIAAQGPTGTPRIRVFNFDGLGNGFQSNDLIDDFLAFDSTFKRGLYVTAVDLNGDGKAEILAARNAAGFTQPQPFEQQISNGLNVPPVVKSFTYNGKNFKGKGKSASLSRTVFPSNFKSGVRLGSWSDGGAGFGLAASGPGVKGTVKQLDSLLIDTLFASYQQNDVTRGLFIAGSKRHDGLPETF